MKTGKKDDFGTERESPCQLPFQINWLTSSMAGKVLEKIGILLNDLESNFQVATETSKMKMLSLLWLDSTQLKEVRVVKKKTRNVRANAAADAIFYQNK